jgi:hypothetical protein
VDVNCGDCQEGRRLVVWTTYEEVCEQLLVGGDIYIGLAKGEEAGEEVGFRWSLSFKLFGSELSILDFY